MWIVRGIVVGNAKGVSKIINTFYNGSILLSMDVLRIENIDFGAEWSIYGSSGLNFPFD